MPEVISRMGERIDAELNPAEAGELWTAAGILMSVPFGKDFAVQMLRSRSHLMEDSPFYQYILDQGMEKGRHEGEIRALHAAVLHLGQKKFGPPPNAVRMAIHAIEDQDILDALLLKLLDVGNWLDLLENIPESCAAK